MKLFDLHCDTATRLLGEKQALYENDFHISLKRADYLSNYAQVMAVWTDRRLSDSQGFSRFLEVFDNLKNEVEINKDHCSLVRNSSELSDAWSCKKAALILAVEDARILENDIARIEKLRQCGVKILTLNWSGDSCIGGAHNTYNGLTDFGIQVVEKCFEIGIIPDISHCSFEGARMTLELAKKNNKPIIASHSDSYSVCTHTRNLLDRDALDIASLSGLIGINLCPEHLTSSSSASIDDIMRHIEHYLALGIENTLAMGGDLDGTNLPNGFSGIHDIYKVANEMQRLNYSTEITEKVLYKNALIFFKNNL